MFLSTKLPHYSVVNVLKYIFTCGCHVSLWRLEACQLTSSPIQCSLNKCELKKKKNSRTASCKNWFSYFLMVSMRKFISLHVRPILHYSEIGSHFVVVFNFSSHREGEGSGPCVAWSVTLWKELIEDGVRRTHPRSW